MIQHGSGASTQILRRPSVIFGSAVGSTSTRFARGDICFTNIFGLLVRGGVECILDVEALQGVVRVRRDMCQYGMTSRIGKNEAFLGPV